MNLNKFAERFDEIFGGDDFEPRYNIETLRLAEKISKAEKNGAPENEIRQFRKLYKAKTMELGRKKQGMTRDELFGPLRKKLNIFRETGSAWKAGFYIGKDEETTNEIFVKDMRKMGIDPYDPSTYP